MSAIVPASGPARQLDGRAQPDEVITPEDAADTTKLAKLLIRILRELAELRRRWWPRRIDFEDRSVVASTKYRFVHSFGTRVRWWVVDWKPTNTGVAQYAEFFRDASSDTNTLVLLSSGVTVGVVTIRVEEAG